MVLPQSNFVIASLASVAVFACASGVVDEQAPFASSSFTAAGEGSEDENAADESSEDESSEDKGGSDEASGDGDADGGDGPRLDLEGGGAAETSGDDGGGSGDGGCEKIDLILSIDASSSMQAELDSLYNTFLEVKSTIANEVGDGIDDFHVGVMNACNKPPFFHNWGANHTNCGFPANQNWLESSDPALDMRFACVIDIPFQDEALQGNGGDNGGHNGQPDLCSDGADEDEQPALAAAAAVQPGVVQNAGMVRDDAILFVVAITDEDEALADVGDPSEIYELFMEAKEPGEVVFLGIGGSDCPSAYDGGNVDDSQDLAAVAAAFGDFGLFRTMCAGQSDDPIRDAFQEALTTLADQACDEFIPPE